MPNGLPLYIFGTQGVDWLTRRQLPHFDLYVVERAGEQKPEVQGELLAVMMLVAIRRSFSFTILIEKYLHEAS